MQLNQSENKSCQNTSHLNLHVKETENQIFSQHYSKKAEIVTSKEISDFKFDVSIICVIYNSSFERIKLTLDSALVQRGVRFEIVIADDGSADNHKEEIIKLFNEYNFLNYKLVFNEKNQGILSNFLSGLSVSEGKYAKGIGPGDFFYRDTIFEDWINYMETNKKVWSFSDIVNYIKTKSGREVVSVMANPQDITPYVKGDLKRCRWNYLVLHDIVNGASIICQTNILREYCHRIKSKGIIYAEDNIFRIMMFEGIVGGYFPFSTIFYERGEGISTSNNDVWKKDVYT